MYPRIIVGINNNLLNGSTHYESLQLKGTKRFGGGFSLLATYTWSKALGIRGGGQGSTTQPPGDIRDAAYGVLGYDRTHVLNIGYSYLMPDLEGSALKQALIGGWQITGVSTWIRSSSLR